jgi:hypothetical protein
MITELLYLHHSLCFICIDEVTIKLKGPNILRQKDAMIYRCNGRKWESMLKL